MARATFTARIDNVQSVIMQFERLQRSLDPYLGQAVRGVGKDAELIFAGHALKDTGRLARGIRFTSTGQTSGRVTGHAREPKSGYDYVGVTRFGHRVSRIQGNPILGGINARRTNTYSGFIAKSVRGFSPSRDWVERGLPQIERQAEQAMVLLGRKAKATL